MKNPITWIEINIDQPNLMWWNLKDLLRYPRRLKNVIQFSRATEKSPTFFKVGGIQIYIFKS